MSDGISVGALESMMDTEFGSGDYVQLHVGAPGAAGTSNVATNNTRVAVGTYTAASASGAVVSKSNTAAINWTAVAGTETYTHATIWSASSGGTFKCSGAITASGVDSGDDWSIPIGDLVVSMTGAS